MDAELSALEQKLEIQESKVGDDAGIINRKNEVGLIINLVWMIYM
jgi:hypothetical protein